MPATPSGIKGTSTLFSFTPRQVLLTMSQTADQNQKLLHQSIALYLERSGFSKTLTKFLSEAKFEKNKTEGSSVDLEEMCRKYLETCKDAKSTINGQKEEVAGVNPKKEEENLKGKKKKKSKLVSESVNNVEDNQLESLPLVTENKVKDDLSTDAKVENGAETEKKSKHKTKKKNKSNSEGEAKELNGDPDATVSKNENVKTSIEEAAQEEKKGSKKRKRTISKENGEQDTEINADEETKRMKTENLNESQGEEQSPTTNEKTNGHFENGAEKSYVKSSQKKKHKESVEQKPVKAAFQRVQVDKIDFVDERLQDNSYWAKDGAESGYGAKAEEILGQVRGRDFRHEKTKKKRGTYRGGNIDLQSHSVKFNYSDEE